MNVARSERGDKSWTTLIELPTTCPHSFTPCPHYAALAPEPAEDACGAITINFFKLLKKQNFGIATRTSCHGDNQVMTVTGQTSGL